MRSARSRLWLAPALLALACGAPARPAARAVAASPVPLARLALAGAGPFYTLRVPIALQSAAAWADLSDLRVRNAAGETMAFAWATPASADSGPEQRAPAALYKVAPPPAPAASAGDGAAPRPAWIVDTRDDRGALVRLDLTLAPGAQGIYALAIEASDDLQHWRMVEPHAALVRLQQLPVVGGAQGEVEHAGAQPLESTGIALDGVAARYLRLSVRPGAAPPPLEKATVTRARREAAAAPLEWSAPIAPASCELSHCDYALPPHLAPEALQVVLADPDTVGQVSVLGRDDGPSTPHRHPHLLRGALHGTLHALRAKTAPSAPATDDASWDVLAIEDVYWLRPSTAAGELHSPPIRLDGRAWPVLRLQVSGEIGQLGHAPPTLRLGVRPRTLVFLARGAGPFELESTTAPAAAPPLALAQLMPGRSAADPLPADSAVPEAPVASAPGAPASAPAAPAAHATAPPNSPWLWGALLAGVGLMAGFAWTLLRRPRDAQEIDPTPLR
ncbi:MAG: DUF3999 family protein [Burkholderiaceae bacterium]